MFVPLRIITKKFLQLSMRRSIRETIETPLFGELLCRAHKATPGHASQRAAHTHAPDAERTGIRHR